MKLSNNIVIGLEIHIELNTNTKLFCSCKTKGNDLPNSRTCDICLGMPGSKPAVNKKAIEYAIKLAKALNCKISDRVIFSRKSYFYPDLSKNYQITQYEEPIGRKGYLKLDNNIGIIRVHLEEDPASLVHPKGLQNSQYVLVDYNRSGNPLCEIVTEPELKSAEEARAFMKALITILQYLEIFDPKSIIKADANVSIKESGYARSEIKNITGFKEIERALNYEINRQKTAVKNGEILTQDTRSWDAEKKITTLLRKKESEDDYGYIYEPDLAPIDSSLFKIVLPELPSQKFEKYVKKFKLSKDDAYVISNEYALAKIFEKASSKIDPVLAAKWIRRELTRVLNYNKIEINDMNVDENELIKLLGLLQENKITDKIGQNIIEKLAVKNFDVKDFIKKNKLETVSDSGTLHKFCKEAIQENTKAVLDYKAGKHLALNFLLGQVMRKAKGKADPKVVAKILTTILKSG